MKLKPYIQQNLEAFDDQKMDFDATDRFKEQLKNAFHSNEGVHQLNWSLIAFAACLALLITFTGISVSHYEISKKQWSVMNSLVDESAGQRLEGIYAFELEFDQEDIHIIETLIALLHNDTNVNVKIAAIDALLKYPENRSIRSNLIKALENEKQPMVQIKLIK